MDSAVYQQVKGRQMYKITMKSGWVQILLECSMIFKWSEIIFVSCFYSVCV